MSKKVYVMNRPEDYKKYHVLPNEVQKWEDGRRGAEVPGMMENWYFDAILDDGGSVMVCFRPKNPADIMEAEDHPNFNFNINTPDGKQYSKMVMVPKEKSFVKKGDGADVTFGDNYLRGNLKDYDIHVEPNKDTDGIGINIHFHALVKPFRPGTGYIGFDNDGKLIGTYTWLCIPKGEVTGTITIDGKTRNIHGIGYRDHQWPDIPPFSVWHHWIWGRQNIGDYTFAMFDLVANESYNYQHVPVFGILDKNGNKIFENDDDQGTKVEVLERYKQKKTGKISPKKIRYTFQSGDKTVNLLITAKKELQVQAADNILFQTNEAGKAKAAAMMKKLGLENPAYTRYLADTDWTLSENGHVIHHQTGEMIYEFAYFGPFTEKAYL